MKTILEHPYILIVQLRLALSIKSIPFLVFVICLKLNLAAQSTQTGLQGMVAVPTASILEDRQISVGMQTNDATYKFITKSNRTLPYNNEHVYSINLGFIPRFNIILGVVHDRQNVQPVRQGIGDRSIQVSYLLMTEKKYLPAIVINLTDPFFSTREYQNTNHIVVTKNFFFSQKHKISATLGYGSPYYIQWEAQKKRTLSELDSKFLINEFGGIQWTYNKVIFCSAEFDGQKVNIGACAKLFNHLLIDTYLLGMKKPGFGINYIGKIK